MELKTEKPKIFITSGKARHGKDTTAAIIKEYYESKGKSVINLQYSSYIKEYAKKISNWDGSEETKPRSLLQVLGTDVIRKNIDSEFFVKRICGDIQVYSYFFDIITISDVREPLEIDVPKREFPNVYAFRINRINFDSGMTEEQKNHYTEIALDDYEKFDKVFLNDSDIESLKIKVENYLEELK